MPVDMLGAAENFYVSSMNEKAASKPPSSKEYVSHDEFLKLLVTQLTNQDPLNPMQDMDMMGQLAQIQALDEQIAMTKSMNRMRLDGQLQGASGMVGKHINGVDMYGNPASGVVNRAIYKDEQVFLELENMQRVIFEDLENVVDVQPQPTITDVSSLIHMHVTGKDIYGNTQAGIVERGQVNGTRLEVKLYDGQTIRVSDITNVRALTPDEELGLYFDFVPNPSEEGV